jgi:hypothetical protein
VAVMTEGRAGGMPAMQPLTLGPEWKRHAFALSSFETDGHDLVGLGIVRSQEVGAFEFRLDQVEIR